MKANTKKEIDMVEMKILTSSIKELDNQLEKAVIYYWLNEIKPEWKTLDKLNLDLSEFEGWV